MHVVYVLAQGKGGLPHYAAELANAVAKYEDVTVVKPSETSADDVFSDDVDVVDLFEPLEISIPDLYKLNFHPVRLARSFYSYRKLAAVKELDPDVVHDVMGLFAHLKFFAYRYDLSDECPFVVTYHELTEDRYPLSHPPMFVSHLIKDAIPDVDIDAGIVHTEKQASILRASGYRPETVEVIPHGAYDFFTDYDYDRAPEEDNTVLFFGNVIREKGIDVLIEAIPMVKAEIPDVKLVVAGDGSLSKRSRQIIDAHPDNFEIKNHFVPNDEVGTLFSRAQLVALPYRPRGGSKGHSGSLSTAFSFGKPVVASNAGDFPRLVDEAETGLVVPSDDPAELADAIVEVLGDDDRRRELAENSARMAERLSWDNIAERHVDLYERVVANFEGASGVRERPVQSG